MGEVPVGAVSAPVAPAAPEPRVAPSAAKAAKLAALNAGLKALPSETGTAPSAPVVEKPANAAAPATPPPASDVPAEDADAAAPIVEKPAAKVEPVEEKPDAQTAKGLAAIDKQAAKFRAEQKTAREELAMERADLARRTAELNAKAGSLDELRTLAKKNPVAALAKLGIESEDDLEVVAKTAYANSKTGKADPRNKAYAEQTAKEREYATKLEALEAQQAELKQYVSQRDQQAALEQARATYSDAAVKAIPAEPSLIGTLHAKNPGKARSALLELGIKMERDAAVEDGAQPHEYGKYTPSHAAVVAEYEKQRRAELEEQGVDVDAMLKRTAPAPAKTAAKTLDITTTTGTRPVNGNPSKAERLAAISSNLSKQFTAT